MNGADIKSYFDKAPTREFENGSKIKGYFQSELKAAGISKSFIKGLVRDGVLKVGHVHLKQGIQNFYTTNDIK